MTERVNLVPIRSRDRSSKHTLCLRLGFHDCGHSVILARPGRLRIPSIVVVNASGGTGSFTVYPIHEFLCRGCMYISGLDTIEGGLRRALPRRQTPRTFNCKLLAALMDSDPKRRSTYRSILIFNSSTRSSFCHKGRAMSKPASRVASRRQSVPSPVLDLKIHSWPCPPPLHRLPIITSVP